ERQRYRVERLVKRSHRRRLGDLADLGRRRVLTLGQAVDPVVEQQDGDVDVAAQRMDEMVAADRQRVPVASDDPDREILTRQRQTCRDRRRTAVNRVQAIGFQVIREPAWATEAAY